MRSQYRTASLLSNSGVYLLSNIISAAMPLVLLPILTRYLSPAEYGLIAMFQTLLGAAGAIIGLNVVGATGRKYFDGDFPQTEIKYFIAACFQILIGSAAVVFVTLYFLREQMAHWLSIPESWILWAGVVCLANVTIQIRLVQWQVRKEARKYGVLQIFRSALEVLLSLLLVVALFQGAEGRVDAQIIATGGTALLALVLLGRDRLLSIFTWRPAYLKEALAFGVPLIPHVGGIFLLTSVDRFIINAELGLAEAGVYMVAVQLTLVMSVVFDGINKAYVPWLFERLQQNIPEEKVKIVKFTYAWFAIIVIGVGLAFLLGPWLVVMIAGEQYEPAGEVIGWLAMGQGFGGMYLMVTNYIFYSKRTGRLSIATIISGAINVVLLLLLVRFMGLSGAAIAFSIAMAIRFFLTWWVAHKSHPMPWFERLGRN